MKTLVFSSHSKEFQSLADLTFPSKARYAKMWGYDLGHRLHGPAPTIAWERPKFWREALDHCECLFFTGADIAITNVWIPVAQLTGIDADADFYFAVDHHGLQSDSWIMRSNDRTKAFLDRVVRMEGKCNNEQDAMQIILSGYLDYGSLRRVVDGNSHEPTDKLFQRELNRSEVKVCVLPRRAINSLPHVHYGGTGQEPHSWHRGDFVLHMPGKTLEYRLKYMPPYMEHSV